MVMTHGEGPYVIDTEGRRYLDANSGLWNMIAGFDHAGLTKAAQDQYARLPGLSRLLRPACRTRP